MNQFVAANGYMRVGLTRHGKQCQRGVHTFVAAAFLGPIPVGMCVNHKDGNKRNNAVDNLEYVTPLQNIRHAIDVLGVQLGARWEKNPMSKLKLDMVMDIKYLLSRGASIGELASDYCVSQATIRAIRRGLIWADVPPERWSREREATLRELVTR